MTATDLILQAEDAYPVSEVRALVAPCQALFHHAGLCRATKGAHEELALVHEVQPSVAPCRAQSHQAGLCEATKGAHEELALLRRSSSEGRQLGELGLCEIDPPPPSFFFTGCAWGCAFHVGAYRGMVERWGLEQLAKCRWGGNSAGSIMAVAGAVGASWQELEDTYLELARQAQRSGVVGKMSGYHTAALDRLIGASTHIDVAGRLFVGVTLAAGHKVFSSWGSRDELLNTLHASMHIPFYCTHLAPCPGGDMGVDGGLSSTYHKIDGDATLVIDPIGASTLAVFRLEPVFPILGRRYEALHLEGRQAILGRNRPPVVDLRWPSPVAACVWVGRGMEEVVAGLGRALAVWGAGGASAPQVRLSPRARLLLGAILAVLAAWRMGALRRTRICLASALHLGLACGGAGGCSKRRAIAHGT